MYERIVSFRVRFDIKDLRVDKREEWKNSQWEGFRWPMTLPKMESFVSKYIQVGRNFDVMSAIRCQSKDLATLSINALRMSKLMRDPMP